MTAAQYAEREGLHPGTLTHWKWKLRRDARERRERAAMAELDWRTPEAATFVELSPSSSWWQVSERIEVVVGDVVVRVPDAFEAPTLRRVLGVLAGEEEA
ncbi:hypothetical protein [Cognatishimia sp.]|uniref:hypothetical protein n=1 Tax=Cognatishimia sp. TaxID=2211648 RepID=UPI00351646E7|nr:hypothetical protein [Cognatishimia sp.]